MANQPKRAFHTASEPEIKAGQVSDVYFQRTIQILKAKGITKRVKAEIRLKSFPREGGQVAMKRWPRSPVSRRFTKPPNGPTRPSPTSKRSERMRPCAVRIGRSPR